MSSIPQSSLIQLQYMALVNNSQRESLETARTKTINSHVCFDRIQEAGKCGGSGPSASADENDEKNGVVLRNGETIIQEPQQPQQPVLGRKIPCVPSSASALQPPIDPPHSHHRYEDDEEDPPSHRPIVFLDAIFPLNGKSIVFFPNCPTTAEGGDDDDLSSINTDHCHFSYMVPPYPGGGVSSQPQERGGVLGQLEPEYRATLVQEDDETSRDGLRTVSWYELHHSWATLAYTNTSSSSNNNHHHHVANKMGVGPNINNEKVGNNGGSDEENASTTTWGCCPECICGARPWVKMVLFFSVLFLITAMVVVGVGTTMSMENDREQQEAMNSSNNIIATNDDIPFGTNADFRTGAPRAVPLPSPTSSSTIPPTTTLTQGPDSPTVVTLYLTGGRFTDEAFTEIPDQLASLPYDNNDPTTTFLVHLGDWNSTDCAETSYETNVNLFSDSSIPVYFLPGDHDYNDCPDPVQAFWLWETYVLNYETKFWPAPTLWNVTRQEPDLEENFAFVCPTNNENGSNGVLFVGINLLDGLVHNNREWQARHEANLAWIDEQYRANEKVFDVMTVLAHGDPLLTSNDNFFQTFFERVKEDYSERQVVVVHCNSDVNSWSLETQFNGISNLMMVVVEGSIWPPMRMQIDIADGTVDFDQAEWYTL